MGTSQATTIGPALGLMAPSKLKTESRECDRHGAYLSTYFAMGGGVWSLCPQCEQARCDAQAQAVIDRAANARREIAMRNALRRASIPPRFIDRSFDNYDATCDGAQKALSQVRTYAENFAEAMDSGRSLILLGTVGAGKTHLATAAAHQVIAQGHTAVFSSVMDAVRSVKETYRRGAERSERDAIEALIEPDLLILDEVGVQFGSDAEKLILFAILNGRYEQVRPTIIISNLDMAGLTECLGERVVDRLREGGGRLIVFDWPSYRRGAA